MKLAKAIEILTIATKLPKGESYSNYQTAIKLGIEALKRIKSFRTNMGSQKFWQLPGETEE